MNQRKKRLVLNTVTSLAFQCATIICGFIVPRLVLQSFGSEVNGLVNSIKQFLAFISFLELGVGSVVQSSLYKPLSEKDQVSVSRIITSAQRFFRKIAFILLAYIVLLMLTYQHISNQEFGWFYTATLIAAMGISSFAQYYFGLVDRLLLTADQRGYIQYTAQTLTLVLNTIACFLLIRTGATIHIVKLTTSLIYLVRPLVLRIFVNKRYGIDRNAQYDVEPITQKWNGITQHIAAVVLDGTDNIVLTMFASLSDVSIYSVYHLVVYGVKQLFMSTMNGIQALFGELWAKQELNTLSDTFGWVEWVIHTSTVIIFGCTAMLVLPFVSVYTRGVSDADYWQPLFAVLITLANAGHCVRFPYSIMIIAGGHYKQTQHSYAIAALLNIVLSIFLVKTLGLVGVAIGTLVAMLYQTIWMAVYNSRNFIHWPMRNFIKQCFVDLVTILVAVLIASVLPLTYATYLEWLVLALKVFIIWIFGSFMVNVLFYKDKLRKFSAILKKRVEVVS